MFTEQCISVVRNRRFGTSMLNDFLLVPPYTQTGDLICLLQDVKVPMLIREKGVDPGDRMLYQLVGECYAHGLIQKQSHLLNSQQIVTIV